MVTKFKNLSSDCIRRENLISTFGIITLIMSCLFSVQAIAQTRPTLEDYQRQLRETTSRLQQEQIAERAIQSRSQTQPKNQKEIYEELKSKQESNSKYIASLLITLNMMSNSSGGRTSQIGAGQGYGSNRITAMGRICTSFKEDDTGLNATMRSPEIVALTKSSQSKVKKYNVAQSAMWAAIHDQSCGLIIDTPQSIIAIYEDLKIDKQFNIELGQVVSIYEAKSRVAISSGYDSVDSFDLVNFIKKGSTSRQEIFVLREYGVSNIEEFISAAKRMNSAAYDLDPEPSAKSVIAFLSDEAISKKSGRSINSIVASRMEDQKKQEDLHVKNFPYVAVFTCGNDRHVNILACLTGSNNTGNGELVMSLDGQRQVLPFFKVRSVGVERRDGFHIFLTKKHAVAMTNVSSSFVLGLTIVERKSNKIIHRSKAGQFEFVNYKQ
jgi:hypothetical protein